MLSATACVVSNFSFGTTCNTSSTNHINMHQNNEIRQLFAKYLFHTKTEVQLTKEWPLYGRKIPPISIWSHSRNLFGPTLGTYLQKFGEKNTVWMGQRYVWQNSSSWISQGNHHTGLQYSSCAHVCTYTLYMYVRVYVVTHKNKQLPSSNYNGTYLQYGHTFGTISLREPNFRG